jgi:molybdate transport system substrate-binding protein
VVAIEHGAQVHSPQDLLKPEVNRIAVGDPRAVPIGVYAKQFLQKAGIWEQLAQKIVPTENVRGALAAVESGNADAAIVYKTDAQISLKVRVAYSVPANEGPMILYPVALTKQALEPESAKRFINYLAGETAGKIFEKRGFVIEGKPAN